MENNLDNDYKRPNLSNKEYNESSPTKKTLRSNNNQFENSDKKRIRENFDDDAMIYGTKRVKLGDTKYFTEKTEKEYHSKILIEKDKESNCAPNQSSITDKIPSKTIKDKENFNEFLLASPGNTFILEAEDKKIFTSKIYDHLTKSDTNFLIWKLTIPKDEIIKLDYNSKLVYREEVITKRKDILQMDIEINSKSCILKLKLKKLSAINRENHNPQSQEIVGINTSNPYFSHLQEVINSLYFEIEATIQIINYKIHNFSSKIFSYKESYSEIKKEIQLGPEFYSQQFNQIHNNTSTRSNKEKEKCQEDRDNLIIITEISLHKFFELDINKGEGYTGIINEAATCYMNSMLQTLNVLGLFKKAVFQIPISEEEYNGKTNSVALSLQRLFYDLMKDTSPISTDRLVRSFGWGREQISIQHDVQEFNLLLSDVMEKKMKGTPGEGTFSKLFEGKLINYIKCVNVEYKSEKEEKFNDLQLTVKGCKNIYESLNVYTEEELMDNADKYEAEGYGKQTAKKGIKFSKFPPVLILQLKRFEYNARKEAMVKINDYFEFYEQINLSKYMQIDDKEINNFKNNLKNTKNLENDEENCYTLHSVVVHQGNANSGHYFAFIRPTVNDTWVLFNDELVRPADKYEVFNNNFGGSFNSYKHKCKGEIVTNLNYYESNAYILVYIQNSEREKILSPVLTKDINPNLISRFETEKNDEKKIKAKKSRISDNMNVILFSRECIKMEENSDKLGIINSFCDLNHDPPLVLNKSLRMMISFPKNLSIVDFLSFISVQTNIDIANMSLYKYETDESAPEIFLKSRGYFNLELITSEYLEKSLIDLTNGIKKKLICFYLHVNDKKLKLFRKFDQLKNNYKEEWKIQNIFSEVETLEQSQSHNVSNNQNEKIVFICKELNNLAFYNNENLHSQSFGKLDCKNSSCLNSYPNLLNSENEILVFIKELKNIFSTSEPNNKYNIKFDQNNIQLKITKIFKINKNYFNNFYEFENYISGHIQNDIENTLIEKKIKISFLLEKREGFKTPNIVLTENNYLFNFSNTNSIVLIPFLESQELEGLDIYPNIDLVLSKINSLYNSLYIDIFSQDLQSYIIQKLKINDININEDGLRDLIWNTIKGKKIYKELIIMNSHYLFDQNKNLNLITENFLSNYLSQQNFDILSERDKGPKFAQACKEIPILKFLNFSECRIDFNFSLCPKQNLNDSYLHHLTIYDIDNIKICHLSIIFPKKLKKSREIIEYMYNTVLINKNIVREIYDKDQYYFILQNPKKNYIYQMLVDNNSDLSKFEGKAEILEYRLQPFPINEIEIFFDSNHYKIFVSFCEKFKFETEGETDNQLITRLFNKVVFNPFVIFIKKNQTLFELKFTINEKIKKVISREMQSEKIQIIYDQIISDFFEYLNISYFTSKIKDNKVHKEVNLQHFKEEEYIENILKDGRVYNILVDISMINSRIKME